MFILFCSQSAFFVIVLITKIEFMSTFSLSKRLSARILAAVLLTFTFTFCSYDDSELRNSMQELQDRITELEKTSGLLQNDINSLKAIFEKLNDAVTVDSAVETEEGWTITFSDGTYNRKNEMCIFSKRNVQNFVIDKSIIRESLNLF